MSSEKAPDDNNDSVTDVRDASMADSEMFVQDMHEQNYRIAAQIQRAHSTRSTPVQFSGLAIKSASQHNLGFHKVRNDRRLLKQAWLIFAVAAVLIISSMGSMYWLDWNVG